MPLTCPSVLNEFTARSPFLSRLQHPLLVAVTQCCYVSVCDTLGPREKDHFIEGQFAADCRLGC